MKFRDNVNMLWLRNKQYQIIIQFTTYELQKVNLDHCFSVFNSLFEFN